MGHPDKRIGRAAFTLLEILLTLGLMALLAGVLVTGSARLLGDAPVTAEEVFWRAVAEGRKSALEKETETRLRFDAKERAFVFDGAGAPAPIPVPAAGEGESLKIDFLPTARTGSTVLLGGELVESQTIPFVSFYADGTCSFFRVQIRTGGPARLMAIDPWTCAPVLKSDDNAL